MRSKRSKGNKRVRILAVLIFTAVATTCFVYPYFYAALLKKGFNPDSLIRVSDLKKERGIQTGAVIVSNKLAILRDKTLRLHGGNGDVLWTRPMDCQEPFIAALGNTIVVTDIEKGILYGLNDEGKELWQITTVKGIGRIGADGGHIWTIGNRQGTAIIEVFNQKGENISYIQIEGAKITGVSVTRDSSIVAVSTVGVEDGGIVGRIIAYKGDGTILWAKSYRDILVMDLKFTIEDSLHVLTEGALMSYNTKGKLNWQRKIHGYIIKALLTDEGIVALNVKEDYRRGVPIEEKGETLIYGKEGVLQNRFEHSERIIGLVAGQGCVGIYSDRHIKFASFDGKKVWDKGLNSDILEVYLLENNYGAYVFKGKLHFEPIL